MYFANLRERLRIFLFDQASPPRMNFEEVEKFIKIQGIIFVVTVGIWYKHLTGFKHLKDMTSYDIVISASMLGIILLEFRSFYLYGLLLLDTANYRLLNSISRLRGAFYETWPIYALTVLILILLEKLYPGTGRDNLLPIFISIICLSISGIFLKVRLNRLGVRMTTKLADMIFFPLLYIFLSGIIAIWLKEILPVIDIK
ncbi:MAG TPA: hypothetical protein DHV16_06025 [Nitrospiraceae bacterium]|nr:hypothetical protein [Nitrospiraceae bacterium]